jgi:hypothetical protein
MAGSWFLAAIANCRTVTDKTKMLERTNAPATRDGNLVDRCAIVRDADRRLDGQYQALFEASLADQAKGGQGEVTGAAR